MQLFFYNFLKEILLHKGNRNLQELRIATCCVISLPYKLIPCNSMLLSVSFYFSFKATLYSHHGSDSASQSAREGLGREATERTLGTDSKLRERPLIRADLRLQTALFTLVSQTHSWPIVIKHGETLGQSSSRPLWPTVSVTN